MLEGQFAIDVGKQSLVTLTSVEKPECLEFTRLSQNSWASLMVLPLLSLMLIGLAWAFHVIFLAILAAIVLFAFLANRRNGSTTVFTVTQSEVESHGNLGYISRKDVIMEASEVAFLGYSTGGAKTRLSGLYAGGSGLFGKTCVMPFITQDQAGEIVDKIRRKFPMFEAAIAAALPDDVAPQIKP